MTLKATVAQTIQNRLLALTPRAFELFAGDLLVYMGLENVSVTRYVGDGGIDAEADVVTGAGLVRLATGVQVKRKNANVQRPDIDRFLGALAGRYALGIFITNARYSKSAIEKANSAFPRILTIDGHRLERLMLDYHLGVRPHQTGSKDVLDEDYFLSLEERTRRLHHHRLREPSEGYGQQQPESEAQVEITPADDLISLQALSYALRVDTTTIRRWVETGKLQPDERTEEGKALSFRRDRIEAIRAQMAVQAAPASGEAWREAFLDFAQSRQLTKSYKPVLMRVLLRLVNEDGEVPMGVLVDAFRDFYIQREMAGLPVEVGASPMQHPSQVKDQEVQQLIVRSPLERLLINGFVSFNPEDQVVRITPELWAELRYADVLKVLRNAEAQLDFYYSRSKD